jgi:Rrf2 family protein
MRLELTRRADYAVRAMIALARHGDLQSGSRIASEMDKPPRLVGPLFGRQGQAGLVTAAPARRGGDPQGPPPQAISILTIVEAVEGDARRRTCVLRSAPCLRDGVCDVHWIFSDAQDALLKRLDDASLATVLQQR